MVWRAQTIELTPKQEEILTNLINSRTARQDHITRARIILLSASGISNLKIALETGLGRLAVGKWRKRWSAQQENLQKMENDTNIAPITYRRHILGLLSDEERPGAPPKFTEEQLCQILSVSCERPEESNLPLSHWSLSSLASELQRRGIVDKISTSHLSVFLKQIQSKTT